MPLRYWEFTLNVLHWCIIAANVTLKIWFEAISSETSVQLSAIHPTDNLHNSTVRQEYSCRDESDQAQKNFKNVQIEALE